MADVKFHLARYKFTEQPSPAFFTVSTAGFGTPKGVIVIGTRAVTDGADQATAAFGYGFSDGTRDRVVGFWSSDGVTSANVVGAQDNAYCFGIPTSGGGFSDRVRFSQWVTDGVELEQVDQNVDLLITVIIIGGADVADFYVNHASIPGGSPATVDVTDPGFEPDLVFTAGSFNSSTIPSSSQDDAAMVIGITHNDGSNTQKGICISDAQGVGVSDANGYYSTDSAIPFQASDSLIFRAQVEDFDANGFTIDVKAGETFVARVVIYAAIRFTNNPDISLFDESGPATPQSPEEFTTTAPGFTPVFGMYLLANTNSVDTGLTSNTMGFSVVGFDADDVFSNSIFVEAGASTMNTGSRTDDQVLVYDDDGTVFMQGGQPVFNGSGWTFPLTTIPSVANQMLGLAIGEGGATSPISPKPSPMSPQGEGGSPLNGPAATFLKNTIINANPIEFDESPVIGSPANLCYLHTDNPDQLVSNTFLFSNDHAICLLDIGTFGFQGNIFTNYGADQTLDAALYNGVGPITLNVSGGGDTPTKFDRGSLESPNAVTTINNVVNVTITDLEPGTEVRVYPAQDFNSPVDLTEIDGVENSGSPSEFTFSAAAGQIVDIVVLNIDFVLPPDNRIRNFTVPTSDTSFPVSQIVDRNFSNP